MSAGEAVGGRTETAPFWHEMRLRGTGEVLLTNRQGRSSTSRTFARSSSREKGFARKADMIPASGPAG